MRPGTTFRAAAAVLGAIACLAASIGPAGAASAAASPAPVPAIAPTAPIPDKPFALERDQLFAGVNADRATAGLVRFVRDPSLERVAQDRAEHLAASGVFGHPQAGAPILDSVEATGIAPYAVGETLGWSGRSGTDAFASIRAMWAASPSHHAIVVSDLSSYAGVGVTIRGGRTFVVLVTAETADRTPPVVDGVSVDRGGATLVVAWKADDPLLQSHTAGVRDATVQYRVAGGPWRVLQRANARGSATLPRLAAGTPVEVRVRVRDRAGNLSSWVETAKTSAP
jgi:uncharacterized protein YkwD